MAFGHQLRYGFIIWHRHTHNDLALEKITTGEKAGLWGTITNTNLQILEQASSGYTTVDMAGANVTLSTRLMVLFQTEKIYTLKLTGTLSGNRTLTMPNANFTGGGSAN